jgi:hypothetical protein
MPPPAPGKPGDAADALGRVAFSAPLMPAAPAGGWSGANESRKHAACSRPDVLLELPAVCAPAQESNAGPARAPRGAAARLHDLCDGRIDGVILGAPTLTPAAGSLLPGHTPCVLSFDWRSRGGLSLPVHP